MKAKEKQELQSKTIPELTLALGVARKNLFALKLEFVRMKLKNTRALWQKRKEIALLETFLTQKKLLEVKK